MYCDKCKNKIDDDSKFCAICGSPVKTNTLEPTDTFNEKIDVNSAATKTEEQISDVIPTINTKKVVCQQSNKPLDISSNSCVSDDSEIEEKNDEIPKIKPVTYYSAEKNWSTCAMICGITGLIDEFFIIVMSIIGFDLSMPIHMIISGLFLGILGLFFGIKELKKGKSNKATAAVVMCIICLMLTIINGTLEAYKGVKGNLFFQQTAEYNTDNNLPSSDSAEQSVTLSTSKPSKTEVSKQESQTIVKQPSTVNIPQYSEVESSVITPIETKDLYMGNWVCSDLQKETMRITKNSTSGYNVDIELPSGGTEYTRYHFGGNLQDGIMHLYGYGAFEDSESCFLSIKSVGRGLMGELKYSDSCLYLTINNLSINFVQFERMANASRYDDFNIYWMDAITDKIIYNDFENFKFIKSHDGNYDINATELNSYGIGTLCAERYIQSNDYLGVYLLYPINDLQGYELRYYPELDYLTFVVVSSEDSYGKNVYSCSVNDGKYVGTWQIESGRSSISITSLKDNEYFIEVRGSGGASTFYQWYLKGTFKNSSGGIEYSNGANLTIQYQNNIPYVTVNSNSESGIFAIDNNILIWVNNTSQTADTFKKIISY